MIEPKDITGIILAGGKSSRFGSNKALSCLNGVSLLQHAIHLIHPFCSKLMISGNCSEYQHTNTICLKDSIPDLGPIGGIYTAMLHAETRYLLCVTCDMPLMQTGLIVRLLSVDHNTEITYWRENQSGFQFFPLLIDCHLKSLLKNNIDNNLLKIKTLLINTKSHCLQIDPSENKFFLNINQKSDIEELMHYVS